MIRVEGHPNLYRDENSGAIINHDISAYSQYLKSLEQRDLKRKEMDEMRKDIDEIKSLLKEILKDKHS